MNATVEALGPAMRMRLTNRLVKEYGMTAERASFCVDEMVCYFRQIAQKPKSKLVPTDDADAAWHVLLTYTREYAAFCKRVCGRFIHQRPWDEDGVPYPDPNAEAMFGYELM